MKKRKKPFLIFLTCVLAVPTCAALTGEWIPSGGADALRPWLAVGVLLGAAHLLLRPVLRLICAPLGCMTLGLFGLVIDVALICGCGALVAGFHASGLLYPLLTAILINAVCAVAAGR